MAPLQPEVLPPRLPLNIKHFIWVMGLAILAALFSFKLVKNKLTGSAEILTGSTPTATCGYISVSGELAQVCWPSEMSVSLAPGWELRYDR